MMKEQRLPGWLSKSCTLDELPRGLGPWVGTGKGGRGVGVARREAGPWGGGQGCWGQGGTWLGGRPGALPGGSARSRRGPAVPRRAPPLVAC